MCEPACSVVAFTATTTINALSSPTVISAHLQEVSASRNLKYMLLCKVMMGKASDVESVVTGKIALKYV
jgi:hypothetical protein